MSKKSVKETAEYSFTWKQDAGLFYGDCGSKNSEKVLAFDMDGTLINVKSGAKFPKNKDDWAPWDDKVAPTIKEYHDKGYKIAIMTNQKGIEKKHTTAKEIQDKITDIVNYIGVPMAVLISSASDHYRKPGPGMWRFMQKNMNGGVTISAKDSIYCGDAAGRPKRGKSKADHEDTDYKFAKNCGVQFKTPEMLFHGATETLPEFEFNPRTIKSSGSVLKGKTDKDIKGTGKEMIIFVGPPGSGKSTLWQNHLSDYVRVNNDTLKTKDKCLKVAEESLKAGKSCVIDNTNPHSEARKPYLTLAKKYDYPVRAFYFDVPKPVSFHLNDLRTYNVHRDHNSGNVPKMIIHKWYKDFENPTTKEGFKSVETVELIAGPFKSKEDEDLFYSYVSSKK